MAFEGFVRLLQRDYLLPDGRTAVWDLHDTAASVAVLPLTAHGGVVCVRQFRPGPDRVVLSIPGGLVDDGERPVDAAAR